MTDPRGDVTSSDTVGTDADGGAPSRRWLGVAVRWLGTAGFVAIVALVVDVDALWARLSALSLPWLGLALALSVPMYLMLAWRWWFIARRIDAPLSYRHAVGDYYLSTLLNQTMPIGIAGDAVRAIRHARRLERAGHADGAMAGMGPAVRALLLERFSGALVLALVVLVVAVSLAGRYPRIAAVSVAVVVGAGLIAGAGLLLARRRRGRGVIARFISDGRAALLVDGSLFFHLVLSTATLAILIGFFYIAARATGAALDGLRVAQVAPLILASMWLPLSFAGWGAREAVTAALFAAMGLSVTSGVAISVTFGVINLMVAAPGLAVLLVPDPDGNGPDSDGPDSDKPGDEGPEKSALSRDAESPYAPSLTHPAVWPLWMAAASVVAVAAGDARYFSVSGGLAFIMWALAGGRPWAAGPANWVTLGRVALTGSLAVIVPYLDRPLAVALIIGCFLMDGVDGWLARKTGTASRLGATYDMESDAYLVTMLCLLLCIGGHVGVWGLIAGWWRYAYALTIEFLPSAGEVPRSQLARYAYAALVVSLVTAFAFPAVASPVIAIGTVLVSYSFGRSLFWSFRSRAGG